MDSNNVFPFKKPEKDEDGRERRAALSEKIYKAIVPLLGSEQAKELIRFFRSRFDPRSSKSLYPVVDQFCEHCGGQMKIEEDGGSEHFITSCTKCGYMDLFSK